MPIECLTHYFCFIMAQPNLTQFKQQDTTSSLDQKSSFEKTIIDYLSADCEPLFFNRL